jgi:hypothetical protein
MFGYQPELWALTPEAFESDSYPADSVGECFGALGTLGKCEGLNEFLAQRQNVDVFVFGSFRRAPGGGHTYDFGHFSRELVKALEDFELDRAVRPSLLSVGHFAQALHNLRRNIKALLRERDPEDINRPARHGAITSILGFHSRLPAVEGSVRDKLQVQNCELDIDVYAPIPAGNPLTVFTLTALARLRSFGKVNATSIDASSVAYSTLRKAIHAIFRKGRRSCLIWLPNYSHARYSSGRLCSLSNNE